VKGILPQTSKWLLFGFVLALIFQGGFSSGSVKAFSFAEFPPAPILYGGHVYINDQLVEAETELQAQVGDYLVTVLVEPNGLYRNLLVQPPDSSYYDRKITFNISDMVAVEVDVFTQSASPIFKTTFDIHFLQGKIQVILDSEIPLKEIKGTVVKDGRAKGPSYFRSIIIAGLLFAAVLVSSSILFMNRRRFK
jgi:hypothetical protein